MGSAESGAMYFHFAITVLSHLYSWFNHFNVKSAEQEKCKHQHTLQNIECPVDSCTKAVPHHTIPLAIHIVQQVLFTDCWGALGLCQPSILRPNGTLGTTTVAGTEDSGIGPARWALSYCHTLVNSWHPLWIMQFTWGPDCTLCYMLQCTVAGLNLLESSSSVASSSSSPGRSGAVG